VTDAALRPLIGKRADGGWGRGISTWVIVTTLIGNPTGILTTSTAARRRRGEHPHVHHDRRAPGERGPPRAQRVGYARHRVVTGSRCESGAVPPL
jgi:hypothetical protein